MKFVVYTFLSATIFLAAPAAAQCGDTSAKAAEKGKASKKTETTTLPSAQDIANAKSQGLVWVNPGARVYYKEGEFYGRTKSGKFINENDAVQQGFHEAKAPAASKKAKNKKKPDQSGIDGTIDTHGGNTPPKP
ncbi:MAG: hypothetical protein ABIZ80_23160 [Bryobacteraceae bacterium]